MNDQVINYQAAKGLLENAGVEFKDPNVVYSSTTVMNSELKAPQKKSKASKSQQRREARNHEENSR